MNSISAALREQLKNDKGLIEYLLAASYRDLLDKPFSALDGGAHAGFHTFRLARLKHAREVYAIEAAPAQFRKFTASIDLLPAGIADKIRPIEVALQSDPTVTSVTFMESPSHPGRSGIKPVWQFDKSVQFNAAIPVPATTIDQLGKKVHFIKLDLEGGEFTALKGAERTLRTSRPTVIFEYTVPNRRTDGATADDYFQFAKRFAYSVVGVDGSLLDNKGFDEYWYAWLVPLENVPKAQAVLRAVSDRAIAEGRRGVYSSDPLKRRAEAA